MKSKRRALEDAVVTAAQAWLDATKDERDRAIEHAETVLVVAVSELNEYIEEITDKAGPHNGTPTSAGAALLSRPKVGTLRRRIIDEIRGVGLYAGWRGLTDDDLEQRLHRDHQSVSSARYSLVHAGWLTDSGFTRKTRHNKDATVWVLTHPARELISSPEWIERNQP